MTPLHWKSLEHTPPIARYPAEPPYTGARVHPSTTAERFASDHLRDKLIFRRFTNQVLKYERFLKLWNAILFLRFQGPGHRSATVGWLETVGCSGVSISILFHSLAFFVWRAFSVRDVLEPVTRENIEVHQFRQLSTREVPLDLLAATAPAMP